MKGKNYIYDNATGKMVELRDPKLLPAGVKHGTFAAQAKRDQSARQKASRHPGYFGR